MQNYLAAIGDSITFGLNASKPYTSEVSFPSGLSSNISNYGVAGQSVAMILTNINTYFPVGRSNNVVVLWAGTNDLVNSVPPATVFSNLQSAAAALRANGFKVIVCTCLSRTGLSDTTRATFNSSITSNPSSFDAIVDFGPTPLGVNGGSTNTTWFGDGIHPTQAGIDTYETPLIQAAINSFSYPLLPQKGWKTQQFWSNHGTPTGSLTTSILVIKNAPSTQGNIVVVEAWGQGASFATITDTLNSTWIPIGTPQSAGGFTVVYYYSVVPSTGLNTITITGTFFNDNRGVLYAEYGVPDNTVSVSLQSILSLGSGNGITSGSLSPKVGDQLVFLGFASNFGFLTTGGAGYTLRIGANAADAVFLQDAIASVAAPQTTGVTFNSSLSSSGAFLDFNAVTVFSSQDCRNYGTFPNNSINVQGTLQYTVPAHPSVTPPVDSRAAGAPVDSRIPAIIPTNSRTPGTFGPGQ